MLISCDSCDTTFNLDESLLKPTGSKVRCSNCQSIFVVYPPVPSVEIVDDDIQQEVGSDSDDVDELGFDLGMEIDTDPETEGGDGENEPDTAPKLEMEGIDEPEIVDSGDMPTDSLASDIDDGDGIEETEGLDLEDLGLELDDAPASDGIEDGTSDEPASNLDDFEDIELLGMEEESSIEEVEDADEADGLDLENLGFELTDIEAVSAAEDEDAAEEIDAPELEDLELELDITPEPGTDEDIVLDEPDLETDGLEDLELSGDETAPEAADGLDVEETESLDLDDLELELDITPEPETDEDIVLDEPDLETDGLEDLELSGDETAPEAADGLDVEETESLDLDDLELELDVTPEPGTDEETVPDEPDPAIKGLEEFELSGTEAATEDEAIDDLDIADLDDMLEIDIPSESEEEAVVSAEPEPGGDDSESVEEGVSEDSDIDYDTSGMDLLEVDEIARAEDVPEGTSSPDPSGSATEEDVEADDPEATESQPFSMGLDGGKTVAADGGLEVSGSKRKISPWMGILLIVVLAVAGGYAVLRFSSFEIPLLSGLFGEEIADPHGNLMMTIIDVTNKFIDNPSAGKLFVVNGKVRNDYPETRGFIRVKGKLYSSGQILARTEIVFCGNILTGLDLSHLDLDAIQQRLQNRFGDNRSNMRVGAEKQIPFMIVFSNLPENLEEFNIEIEGSLKL